MAPPPQQTGPYKKRTADIAGFTSSGPPLGVVGTPQPLPVVRSGQGVINLARGFQFPGPFSVPSTSQGVGEDPKANPREDPSGGPLRGPLGAQRMGSSTFIGTPGVSGSSGRSLADGVSGLGPGLGQGMSAGLGAGVGSPGGPPSPWRLKVVCPLPPPPPRMAPTPGPAPAAVLLGVGGVPMAGMIRKRKPGRPLGYKVPPKPVPAEEFGLASPSGGLLQPFLLLWQMFRLGHGVVFGNFQGLWFRICTSEPFFGPTSANLEEFRH